MANAVIVNSQDISAMPQTVNDSLGVLAGRVLVPGTGKLQVKRPAAANAKGIGVAGHDCAHLEDVSVYNHGLAWLVASANIAVADDVNIADTAGRVKTVSEAGGTAIQRVGVARSAVVDGADTLVLVELKFDRYTA